MALNGRQRSVAAYSATRLRGPFNDNQPSLTTTRTGSIFPKNVATLFRVCQGRRLSIHARRDSFTCAFSIIHSLTSIRKIARNSAVYGTGRCSRRAADVAYARTRVRRNTLVGHFATEFPALHLLLLLCIFAELRIINRIQVRARQRSLAPPFRVYASLSEPLRFSSRTHLTFTHIPDINHPRGLAHHARYTRRLGRREKISGRRKGRRVLLTSLNMLQHPSATRSIASLGRSIPMPVRHYSPVRPRTPSPLPPPGLPLATSADRPPVPPRAFYHRLCVLRQWQTDLNPPAAPLSPAPPSPRSTSAIAAAVVGSQ